MTAKDNCLAESNDRRAFRSAADLPLAGKYGVVRAVLVDPGAKAGRAHGQSHRVNSVSELFFG